MSWKHTRRSTYEIASIHPETGLNDGVRAISVDEWRCTCVFVSMRNEIAIVCLVTSCRWRHKLMFMCGMYHSLFGCFRCFFFLPLSTKHICLAHIITWWRGGGFLCIYFVFLCGLCYAKTDSKAIFTIWRLVCHCTCHILQVNAQHLSAMCIVLKLNVSMAALLPSNGKYSIMNSFCFLVENL